MLCLLQCGVLNPACAKIGIFISYVSFIMSLHQSTDSQRKIDNPIIERRGGEQKRGLLLVIPLVMIKICRKRRLGSIKEDLTQNMCHVGHVGSSWEDAR